MPCIRADRRKFASAFLLAAFLTGTATPLLAQNGPEIEIDRSLIEQLGPAPDRAGAGPAVHRPGSTATRKTAPRKGGKQEKPKAAMGKPPSPPAEPALPENPPAPPAIPTRARPASSPLAATPAVQDEPAHRILFSPQAAELPESAKPELDEVARLLAADAHLFAELRAYAEGASPSGPDDEKNASETRRLSLSRALAARAYLVAQGVPPKRVDVRPLGNRPAGGATAPADHVDIILGHR